MRIIGANPEVTDPIEDKIQDVPLEVKIFMVEVKEIRIHTKVNIKMMAIKATITRVIKDSIILHAEISLKVMLWPIKRQKLWPWQRQLPRLWSR